MTEPNEVPELSPGKAVLFSSGNLGANLAFALFNFAMPQYLNSYHLPTSLIGLLANERSLVGGIVQPIVGRISDRTRTKLGRRRPFFLVGIPLMALSLVALGLHPALYIVLPLVAIAAFFLLVAVDPYFAMMADITPTRQRGRVGAVVGTAAMIGAIVFNLIAAALWSKHEFAVFALTAVGLVIFFAITFFTVKEPPLPVVVEKSRTRVNAITYVKDILSYRELSRYIGAQALYNLGTGGAMPFITLFATQALHVPASEAFLLVIVIVLSTALGAIPAGYLADRIGKRPVLVGGLLLFAAGCFVGSIVPSIGWAVPAMILVGLGNAAPTALGISLLADLSPRERTGEFIGLGSCVWSFAQPIGAVCAGLLVNSQIASTYRHTFMWAAVLIVLAAIVMASGRKARIAETANDAMVIAA